VPFGAGEPCVDSSLNAMELFRGGAVLGVEAHVERIEARIHVLPQIGKRAVRTNRTYYLR